MIALEDCIGLCGFDEDEVAAISEHEHIPEIAAAALANYLSLSSTTFTKLSTRVASDTLRSCSWRCGISSNSTRKDVLD